MLQRPRYNNRYLAGLDLMYYLVLALSFRDTTATHQEQGQSQATRTFHNH